MIVLGYDRSGESCGRKADGEVVSGYDASRGYGDVRSDGSGGIAAQRASLSARLSLDGHRVARTAGICIGERLGIVGGEGQCVALVVLHHQRSRKPGGRHADREIRNAGSRYGRVGGNGSGGIAAQGAGLPAGLSLNGDGVRGTARVCLGEGLSIVGGERQ